MVSVVSFNEFPFTSDHQKRATLENEETPEQRARRMHQDNPSTLWIMS